MTPAEVENTVLSRLHPAVPVSRTAPVYEKHRATLLWRQSPILPNTDRIVTLNLGLGRDSLAMLYLLADGRLWAQGRRLEVAEVSAVLFSDPGAEWASTYALIPRVRRFCDHHGLRFLILAKPETVLARQYLQGLPPPNTPGRREALAARPWRMEEDSVAAIEEKAASGHYHLRPAIMDDYESRCTIATRGKKDCTINHKVEPLRKAMGDLSVERFGLDNVAWGAEVRAGRRRPHLALIGIAADEAERAIEGHPLGGGIGPWYVTEAYPLLEMGLKKSDEADILRECGFDDAHKSGCMMCPFQPVGWYWALSQTDPAQFARIVEYERKALSRNPRMFLAGEAPIEATVAAWRARHPKATVPEILAKTYNQCRKNHAEEE